jgi:hypothetical protein
MMLENKHFPDSILFNKLSDSLTVCQFYWKYDFGSDLSDIRKYYFIGEKTGFFKYGYTSVGKNAGLNLSKVVVQDNGVLIEENKNNFKVHVFSDTLKRLKSTNSKFLSEPNIIPFGKVTFMKL